ASVKFLEPMVRRAPARSCAAAGCGVCGAATTTFGTPATMTSHRHARDARHPPVVVIPPKAGIQWRRYPVPVSDREGDWIPAFAGMTARGMEMAAAERRLRPRRHTASVARQIARIPLTHSPP